MKKRFLSLLCVLTLCLGLLPVTALADGVNAPNTLYVGGTLVSSNSDGGYWTTDAQGKLTESTANDNWNVKYEPSTATLTLSGATIQGGTSTVSVPYGAGIYAQCNSGESVSLTIELIGNNNTITGSFGIYVDAQQGWTVGTNASLLIQNRGDDGSLEVSGSNHGIYVISGTGNASLTINDASVVAKTTQTYSGYAGVCVQSSANATGSPNISLSVNGGSLTASGSASGEGIKFYVGALEATNATTSLTVNNNAIVKAINGIEGYRVDKPIPSGTGIVFDDKEGTVYGDVTLDESLTINEGETLTIPQGSTLNTNNNLTNNGTILVSGGTVTGSLSGGTAVTTPNITGQPTGQTVTEGTQATFSVTASDAQTYQWQQKTAASGSDWTDINSATSDSYTTEATTTSMNNYQYRCVVTSASGVSVISSAATLTVQAKPASVPVTGVKLNTETLELFTGNTATLTATVEPDNATNKNVTWSSDNEAVATVDNSGKITAVTAGEANITVKTEDGNHSADCKVTVTQSAYSISADTTALNFGSVYTGYTQPAAQTVTVKNTGNQSLTLNQPVSTNSFEVGTLTKTVLAAGEAATFTVQPKAGLAVGTYSENITISDSGHVTLSIPATFTVRQYSGGSSDPTYSITLPSRVTGGELKLSRRYAEKGETVTISAIPDEGYELDTLTVTDSKGNEIDLTHKGGNEYTFKMPAGRVEIEVSFREIEVELPFTDVPEGAWYADAAAYVYEHGLMAGTSATTFAPDATTSRSMIATILWRMAGSPVVNYAMNFADVPQDQWYSEAIRWAASEGIVGGYGSGLFGANDLITREQFAVMLYRYAQEQGYDVSIGENTNILSYTDVADLSEYAISAMQWAVGAGIINGTGDGSTLSPQGQATRAQAAVMLMRFCEEYVTW